MNKLESGIIPLLEKEGNVSALKQSVNSFTRSQPWVLERKDWQPRRGDASADFVEERAHILDEQFGLFEAGEVAAFRHSRILHEIEAAREQRSRGIQRPHFAGE